MEMAPDRVSGRGVLLAAAGTARTVAQVTASSDGAAPHPHPAVPIAGHLLNARRRGRCLVELGEPAPPVPAQAGGENLVHAFPGHRWRRLLQPGQRVGIRAGKLLGQGRLHRRQPLPDLHRAALELTEHGEQLLGGARLHFRGDQLGRAATDPAAKADRLAAHERSWKRREARTPGQAPDRKVRHTTMVPARRDAAALPCPPARQPSPIPAVPVNNAGDCDGWTFAAPVDDLPRGSSALSRSRVHNRS